MSIAETREAIEAAKTSSRSPAAYLDTNVLLDVVRGRNRDSSFLLQHASRRGWLLRSSFFALIEVVKNQQQADFLLRRLRRGASVDDLLREAREPPLDTHQRSAVRNNLEQRLRSELRTIDWFNLDEIGWQAALDLTLDTNVSAADSIHVAVATASDCDFIITRDTKLTSAIGAILPACTPREARDLLDEQA